MEANDPEEAHRWTQAIEKSIEWYKMHEGTAVSPFIFTGDNDLHSWIKELDDYFSRNDFQEAEKLPKAMEYLSADVRSAIDKVQDVLQLVIAQHRLMGGDNMNLKALEMNGSEEGPGGGDWSWSYSRLVGALRGMQSEDFSIIHTRGTGYLTDTSSEQIEEYRQKAKEARTNTILKGCAIVGGGIVTAAALPVVVTGVLGLVGFSAGGVVAGE